MAEHIDWDFEKENQEKKVIARSARKKVTHTGCKLLSDFMTNKEKQQLNGEVITMDMNKPVKYQAFKMWPADLQKEYLENLVRTFGAGVDDVGKMMECHVNTFHQFVRSRGLRGAFPRRSSPTKFDKNGWKLFCEGEWREQALQNAPESHENALGATNEVPEGKDTSEEFDAVKGPVEAEKTVIDLLNERINKQISEPISTEKCCCDKLQVTNMQLAMKDVKSWDDIFELLRKYPLPEHNRISIYLTDEGDERWNG